MLVLALSLLFVLVWQAPSLPGFKGEPHLFPVWLHTVGETLAVAMALMVFAVCWHAGPQDKEAGDGLLLGCGFLVVGLLDLGHMLSYRGMPDFFSPGDPEKAIRFWLAARYVAALTLLLVALRGWPRWRGEGLSRVGLGLGALGLSVLLFVLLLGFPQLWPRTFVDGAGLTPFKVGAEYGIVLLQALAALGFHLRARSTGRYDAVDLRTAALITVLSELCFTLYSHVNDGFQLLGHLYKILAYVYIYRAVFVAAVRAPYQRLLVEIEERREAERRVEFLAFHDPLTGLPNRVMARDRVERAIGAAQRLGGEVALLYLDLDDFKSINDSLGHQIGDELLRSTARRLRDALRDSDSICRLSGDEFLIVLSSEGPAGLALDGVVDKLMAVLGQPLVLDGHEILSTVSIGVSRFPQDGDQYDALLRKADTAMYRAKDAGRNTFQLFDERMNAEVSERLQLRHGLAQALERGELTLHYQPQVALDDGRVVGAEALLRWRRPEGLVPPARFIPVAEDSGLILPIGDWVIREACRQLAQWRAQGLVLEGVAVNLSVLQLRRGQVEQVVAQALREHGLPPQCLELELTESMLLHDAETMTARVAALEALGVRLSIDDFGTGYSSLAYLKRLSVDQLKIDRSFVKDLAHDADPAIVRAIIQMARGLGLRTLAEGVEDRATGEALRHLGCELAQGYYYARPMPPEEFAAHVRAAMARAPG
ncbi:EAL domain-containing protein [Pelomonas sp. CA6]|uniref:bifunctional diguanylate cyclase/phosphodiesterase n=1 Tax=Pelomonas sp. CA6 TaxID=2907999 RepID=UPI001F4BFE8F|nr:EAL domain-containing protein [Pelomonas sp. CA6]MCH7345400.1 EAL domain-containing protein [Pelomonas sp. CA6]